jgi:hypothetical protein
MSCGESAALLRVRARVEDDDAMRSLVGVWSVDQLRTALALVDAYK